MASDVEAANPPEIRKHHGVSEGSTNPTRDRIVYRWAILGHEYRLSLHQLQYLTFVTIGLALLWPWNCFLSASEYYSTRFIKQGGQKYAKIYSSTMMSVSTIAQLIYNYYLSQRQIDADYYKRFIAGQVVNCITFLLMAASCVWFLNISTGIFFFFLMALILASSLSCCSSQNGSMAIVNIYGPIYAQGLMVGQAIAGVLPSISLILSIIVVGEKPAVEHVEKNYGVMTYYLTSTVVSILALLLFLAFVYKYAFEEIENDPAVDNHGSHHHHRYIQLVDESGDVNRQLLEEEQQEQQAAAVAAHEGERIAVEEDAQGHTLDEDCDEHVPFLYLFAKLRHIVITLVLVFVISLIFPVFASNIESVNKPAESSPGLRFSDSNIFIPFAFMIWNVGDLAGRIACGYKIFQIHSERFMVLYSVARTAFLPVLFLCNISSDVTSSPVEKPFINSDMVYLFIQFLYGFTNGHLCSACFMNVGPKFTKDSEKKAAGGFTTVFLSIGLALGSVCSYLFVAAI